MNKRICVVNDRLFYLGDGRKLEIFHFQYEFPLKKTSILFIECDEIICNRKNTNGLCASILFKYMLWWLGVIGKLHNDECLIYLFTGEVLNGTPNTFTNSQYNYWFKYLRGQFSPVLINSTHDNVNF